MPRNTIEQRIAAKLDTDEQRTLVNAIRGTRLASVPQITEGQILVNSDAYKANPTKLDGVTVASGQFAVRLLTATDDRVERLGTTSPNVGEARSTGGRIASRVELVPLDSEVIAAARETSRTAAAAPTAWGTSAPEFSIAFDRATPSLTRVAVYINVDDSVWSSAGEAQRIVDTVLRQDVARAVDGYLLSNAGSTGIKDDSAVPTFAKSGSRFDAILDAATRIRGRGFDGLITAIVSPTDHLALLTEVDGDVRVYRSEILKDLGVEVTNSSSAPSGTAVVGSLSESVTLWVDSVGIGTVNDSSEIARVLVSNSHGSNFLGGRVTVMATANVHSRVQRPSGLVTITSF